MLQQKTHKEVIKPQMSVRRLADFMAATETAKRTIVRDCKYQPIARVIHHREAKAAVAKHIWSGATDVSALTKASEALRSRIADSDFDRDLFDHNADYIDRFVAIWQVLNSRLPKS